MNGDRTIDGVRYRIIKDYRMWRIIKEDHAFSRYLRLPSGQMRHWKSEKNASKYLDELEVQAATQKEG